MTLPTITTSSLQVFAEAMMMMEINYTAVSLRMNRGIQPSALTFAGKVHKADSIELCVVILFR